MLENCNQPSGHFIIWNHAWSITVNDKLDIGIGAIDNMLNKQSGFKGIAKTNDVIIILKKPSDIKSIFPLDLNNISSVIDNIKPRIICFVPSFLNQVGVLSPNDKSFKNSPKNDPLGQ